MMKLLFALVLVPSIAFGQARVSEPRNSVPVLQDVVQVQPNGLGTHTYHLSRATFGVNQAAISVTMDTTFGGRRSVSTSVHRITCNDNRVYAPDLFASTILNPDGSRITDMEQIRRALNEPIVPNHWFEIRVKEVLDIMRPLCIRLRAMGDPTK